MKESQQEFLTDKEKLDQKHQVLMTQHLDLMQEQLDLPQKISEILLKIKDHPMGTEEGDSLRTQLYTLEERNRTIHLSIQDNLKELKECEADLKQARSLRKAA